MIDVAVAIIEKEGKFLIGKRKRGSHLENKWEFPGGKVESLETPEECLIRELKEELGITIEVGSFVAESVFNYSGKEIKLLGYRASYISGEPILSAHEEIKWISAEELDKFDFAKADLIFLEKLKKDIYTGSKETKMPERELFRDRIHWAITLLASALGTCNRLLISSSAEKNKRIVGLSYNGSLPGQPHCDDVGHYMINGHCHRTRHAEKNLKDNTDQEKLKGSHVRALGTPCLDCLKELDGGQVAWIEYSGSYNNQEFQPTPEMLKEIFGADFKLLRRDIDWVELFQEIFDRLSGPGGIFNRLGYKIKLVKEPLKK